MFRIKQYLKMFLQNVLLPLVYRWHARRPVERGLVLFADGHHREMPFSMRRMYEAVSQDSRYQVECFVCDFGALSFQETVRFLLRFMKRYAVAEQVFLCDYFLPASSCRKRTETTLTQLWHSCGLMKKIAHDAGEDIPKGYRGDLFGNYTWLTMSAKACIEVHARALQIPAERIRATGICRTDYYFDEEWNRQCRENFYRRYPEAMGKRILLWAPTFRGNAAHPTLSGLEAVRAAARELEKTGEGGKAGQEGCSREPEGWHLVIKAHPHVDAHGRVSNCEIPTEELFPVADVLVTDYSSVLFDWLLYGKPLVLFAPDRKEYEERRGFYIDYRSMPFPLAEEGSALAEAVRGSAQEAEARKEEIRAFREKYTGACDGRATERILALVGMGR